MSSSPAGVPFTSIINSNDGFYVGIGRAAPRRAKSWLRSGAIVEARLLRLAHLRSFLGCLAPGAAYCEILRL
jgi:hypothetical protein